MNSFPSRRGNGGFTLVELLVVIAIIGILAALLLPALNQGKARAKQVFCENNLSEIGIGFHMFGHDHNDKFPMAVSVNDGGAMEFVKNGYLAGDIFYFGYHVFQTVSNQLTRPDLLICPSDLNRVAASNFPDVQNTNISYFYNANADFLDVNSILIGDRNIATNSIVQPTILRLDNGSRLRWTHELHSLKGNVLLADGHVEEWNNAKLKSAAGSLSPADLFMPSVPPSTSPPIFGNPGSSGGGGGSSGGGSGNSNNGNQPASGAFGNTPSGGSSPSVQPRPSMNGNQGNPSAGPSGGKPGSPMIGNNGGVNRNFDARASQNFLSATQAAPVVQNFQTNPQPANDSQLVMSPLDQKIAHIVRGTFEWGYLILLLLLLFFLAYKLWQMLRRDEKRRRRNQNNFPPQP